MNGDTRISSVGFSFPQGRSLDLDRLRQEVALTDPGLLDGARRKLAWLPLVSVPSPIRFDPVELQRDVVRLRRLYRTMGFHEADVSYDVELDTLSNSVDIQVTIHEGPPIILDSVSVSHPLGGPIGDELPSDLVSQWVTLETRVFRQGTGRRFGEPERARLRSESLRWAQDRGYPFASLEDRVQLDTARAVASVQLILDLGPRARIDSIRFEGNQALSRGTLQRELPFKVGDLYSGVRVNEGQRQIFGLPLVRLALADVPGDQPHDSTVTVRYRIDEGRPRLISSEAGYSSTSGIRTRADWTHRDFAGGARSLTFSVDARSAWLALEGDRNQSVGAAVSLRQPYLGDRRISGSLSPFVEYRDGFLDRSWSFGIGGSLLWEKGPMDNISINYRLSRREVLEIRAGAEDFAGVDFINALAALDSLETGVASSILSVSTLHGRVDDPLDPVRGWILRTSLQFAGPATISAVEYVRSQAELAWHFPLGSDVDLTVRGGAGLLHPFGVSSPTPQSDTLALLVRLRDAMLTAGGTQSVRGWGAGLLGPKVPNFRLRSVADSLVLDADRYIPFAGLARLTASTELQLPMPFAESDHGTFLFLDGGKVWNPDKRFGGGGPDPYDQERFFWAAGGGLAFETIAGAVRLSAGYKLNPAPFDLRDPRLVADALVAGAAISSVPTDSLRRFHLHLSLGLGF